jgi:malonyl CoA-acyl carrier protein transacylase
MTLAFVFPGQGAQTIGMGRDLAEAYPEARAVFDTVDDALGETLSDLIWDGDIETLTLTRNAQPALMATSMAAMAALKAEGVEVTAAAYVAGHSLGEYSALCAAGALDLADAARLLGCAATRCRPPWHRARVRWPRSWGSISTRSRRSWRRRRRTRSARRPTTTIRRRWWSRAISGG